MKLISKTLLAALAVTVLSSGAAFADVRRIDHPNGPPTYVTAPPDDRGFGWWGNRHGATIGVFAGERSFGRRHEAPRSEADLNDAHGRALVPMHQGRGQTQ
ncbi:MAG TPA: hypothetical protein VGO11_24620 [Chthoniobacteraceae bacterium]|jgi:hypothetical protein|nr:hypothetical protein [Chthoniobacteraceae bacterium]